MPIDREQYLKDQAFSQTETGKLYLAMIHALGHAWQVDQDERSTDWAMEQAWLKSTTANRAFRDHLDTLMRKAEAYDAIHAARGT